MSNVMISIKHYNSKQSSDIIVNISASNFEILELHDIEKEFMLVDARLRLLVKDNDPSLSAGMN
jgi:hypothetical protein